MISIKPMLEVIPKENSLYIQMIFSYIIRQADTDQEAAKPEDRKVIMIIAERLIEKGKIEGIEQGILQGIEKGAYVRNQQIALNMLRKDIDKTTISEVTGLSISEINSLTN